MVYVLTRNQPPIRPRKFVRRFASNGKRFVKIPTYKEVRALNAWDSVPSSR